MIDEMNRPAMPGEKLVPDAPGPVVLVGQAKYENWEICQSTQNENKYFLVKVGRSMAEYGSVADWTMPEGHTKEELVEAVKQKTNEWAERNGVKPPKQEEA